MIRTAPAGAKDEHRALRTVMKINATYFLLTGLLVPGWLSMVSCKSQQTVTTKSSRYVINTGDDDNSDEIEAQFGTSYAEAFGENADGSGAKRSKLESKMFVGADGGGSDLTSKEFRGVKDFGESKEFRTPEYLKRHEMNTPDAREAGKKSRDGRSVFREGDRTFRGAEELSFWQKLNPFRRRATPAREADKMFRAKDYKRGNKAVDSSLVPEPMGTFGDGIGDYRDNSMSMDDVKRLLSPETYKKR